LNTIKLGGNESNRKSTIVRGVTTNQSWHSSREHPYSSGRGGTRSLPKAHQRISSGEPKLLGEEKKQDEGWRENGDTLWSDDQERTGP